MQLMKQHENATDIMTDEIYARKRKDETRLLETKIDEVPSRRAVQQN